MPDRILRAGLFTSDAWLRLKDNTDRVCYIALIGHADTLGNQPAGPYALIHQWHSYGVTTPEKVAQVLSALSDVDLVRCYSADGKAYVHIPRFRQSRRFLGRLNPIPPFASDEEKQAFAKKSPVNHASALVNHTRPPVSHCEPPLGVGVGVGVGELHNPPVGPPKGGLPPRKPEKPKKQKREAVTFDVWNAACREAKIKHFPETDAVWKFADDVGLPDDYVRLTWFAFRDRYRGEAKRYRDWPSVFRRAVKANWFRLWFLDGEQYALTSTGKVRMREMQATKRVTA